MRTYFLIAMSYVIAILVANAFDQTILILQHL